MILSHRHKFVFMHCRKAAGSSLTVSLSRYLGPLDIQIGAHRDAFDQGVGPNLRALSRLATIKGGAGLVRALRRGDRFSSATAQAIKESYAQVIDSDPAHPLARSMQAAFPRQWDSYFKFCIVRNPYDRVVSDYFWRIRSSRSPPSFSHYVAALGSGDRLDGIVPLRHDNWEMYTIDDRIAVDRIARFETLLEDLRNVVAETGISWDGWLPRSKQRAGGRTEYRDMYSARDAAIVGRVYEKEIEQFGYRFDG